MFNFFKKAPVQQNGNNGITIDRLLSIEGYVPNPSEKKYHIVRTDDVTIFKAFDPNKIKTAPRALYAIGKVSSVTPETTAFVNTYGDRVILVSKKFLKLRKKTQLRLIEKICFEVGGVPDRFMSGMSEIERTSVDKRVAAELLMMEKYGYGVTKRLLKKEQKINLGMMKKAGKTLYKMSKKQSKLPSCSVTTNIASSISSVLQEPALFSNIKPASV